MTQADKDDGFGAKSYLYKQEESQKLTFDERSSWPQRKAICGRKQSLFVYCKTTEKNAVDKGSLYVW